MKVQNAKYSKSYTCTQAIKIEVLGLETPRDVKNWSMCVLEQKLAFLFNYDNKIYKNLNSIEPHR